MSESRSHKSAKANAAGKSGRTEVPLRSGGRLDAKTSRRATEIERSPGMGKLELAAGRLKQSRASQKVLQVPNPNMSKAVKAMQNRNVSGTVKNMSGSRRRSVR